MHPPTRCVFAPRELLLSSLSFLMNDILVGRLSASRGSSPSSLSLPPRRSASAPPSSSAVVPARPHSEEWGLVVPPAGSPAFCEAFSFVCPVALPFLYVVICFYFLALQVYATSLPVLVDVSRLLIRTQLPWVLPMEGSDRSCGVFEVPSWFPK
jgi:hypothetical protein